MAEYDNYFVTNTQFVLLENYQFSSYGYKLGALITILLKISFYKQIVYKMLLTFIHHQEGILPLSNWCKLSKTWISLSIWFPTNLYAFRISALLYVSLKETGLCLFRDNIRERNLLQDYSVGGVGKAFLQTLEKITCLYSSYPRARR